MSKTWWESSRTTQGHGIFSQYKPDHLKEWVYKETRRQERSKSPDKTFEERSSFHRSSLFEPIKGENVEHMHHATTKSLQDLRKYQEAPPAPGHVTHYPTDPKVVVEQPVRTEHLPHLAHHHHFGWIPPTPTSRWGVVDSRNNFMKYGNALGHIQNIQVKSQMITTRKP